MDGRNTFYSDQMGRSQQSERENHNSRYPDRRLHPKWRCEAGLDPQHSAHDDRAFDQDNEYGRSIAGIKYGVIQPAL